MLRYETLLLAVPEITKDESDRLEKEIAKLIKEGSGQLVSYERWGKYRLAYPVRNNEYGVYFLARFETPEEKATELLKNIREFFRVKRHDLIMRSLASRLDSQAPLTYQRPQSLEEVPTRPRETMQYLKEARAISQESPREGKPQTEKFTPKQSEMVEEELEVRGSVESEQNE